jgi:hypothetical protein
MTGRSDAGKNCLTGHPLFEAAGTVFKDSSANRWDEALWRPGVWIKVVEGKVQNIGMQKLRWKPPEGAAGAGYYSYSLVMTRGTNVQIRQIKI